MLLLGVIFILPHNPGALLPGPAGWVQKSSNPCPPAVSAKPAILVAHEWRSPVVLLPRDCSPGWCKATEQRTCQKFNTGIQEVRQPYRGLINLPHTPGWPGDWDAFRKDTGQLHWEQRAKVDLEPTWPSGSFPTGECGSRTGLRGSVGQIMPPIPQRCPCPNPESRYWHLSEQKGHWQCD